MGRERRRRKTVLEHQFQGGVIKGRRFGLQNTNR